jgi:hypothetical protein
LKKVVEKSPYELFSGNLISEASWLPIFYGGEDSEDDIRIPIFMRAENIYHDEGESDDDD